MNPNFDEAFSFLLSLWKTGDNLGIIHQKAEEQFQRNIEWEYSKDSMSILTGFAYQIAGNSYKGF